MRQNISSAAKWETIVAYSRAVKIGNCIEVSGTTAVDENGAIVGPGDVAMQTRFIFSKIEVALKQAGSSLKDVIRTRMYVTDISTWNDVAAVHAEFFTGINPAATMVEVKALIEPGLLIEIEVSAIVESD